MHVMNIIVDGENRYEKPKRCTTEHQKQLRNMAQLPVPENVQPNK